MLKKIVVLVVLLGAILGCTRDDICPEETPTTPLLILRFFDFSDSDNLKPVPGLSVVDGTDSNIELLSVQTTDSIAIPLRNFSNTTRFSFIKDSNSEDPDEVNPDAFNVNYLTQDIYINRACGFKTTYSDLTGQLVNETRNWIISFEVLTPSVENQDEVHIAIFH